MGDDAWGKKYREILEKYNVDTKHVRVSCASTSGIAQINVADSGANQIVIVAGANNKLCTDDVDKAASEIVNADVLLCQLETPVEAAIRAIELCKGVSGFF